MVEIKTTPVDQSRLVGDAYRIRKIGWTVFGISDILFFSFFYLIPEISYLLRHGIDDGALLLYLFVAVLNLLVILIIVYKIWRSAAKVPLALKISLVVTIFLGVFMPTILIANFVTGHWSIPGYRGP